jgi:hypothetical protein
MEVLALECFYMSFHKNNHNKFFTVGRKLNTKTFELVTEFFEAKFTTNKNNGMLEPMELECIKKHAQLKLKNSSAIRIALVRMSVAPTGQGTQLLLATPNIALTTIARSNVDTLTTIAIAPTTTNIKRQSALVLSTLDILTGRMTIATISLKG